MREKQFFMLTFHSHHCDWSSDQPKQW